SYPGRRNVNHRLSSERLTGCDTPRSRSSRSQPVRRPDRPPCELSPLRPFSPQGASRRLALLLRPQPRLAVAELRGHTLLRRKRGAAHDRTSILVAQDHEPALEHGTGARGLQALPQPEEAMRFEFNPLLRRATFETVAK